MMAKYHNIIVHERDSVSTGKPHIVTTIVFVSLLFYSVYYGSL